LTNISPAAAAADKSKGRAESPPERRCEKGAAQTELGTPRKGVPKASLGATVRRQRRKEPTEVHDPQAPDERAPLGLGLNAHVFSLSDTGNAPPGRR
jgi:hypothetical protein